MAGLLLFIPAERLIKQASEVFAAAGLADLLDPHDAAPAVNEELIISGPGGGRGMLWHWPADGDRQVSPVVATDRQTWYECKPRDGLPKGRAWIGYETARPPRPSDLERVRRQVGQGVKMADGRTWVVPLVRELPQIYCYDDAGELATRFNVPRYQHVFDQTWQWVERIGEASKGLGEGQNFYVSGARGEYFGYVSDVLGLNYRVNRDVIDCLGLLVTGDVSLIPYTAGGFLEPEKKS